jgi:hypothetical protein
MAATVTDDATATMAKKTHSVNEFRNDAPPILL